MEEKEEKEHIPELGYLKNYYKTISTKEKLLINMGVILDYEKQIHNGLLSRINFTTTMKRMLPKNIDNYNYYISQADDAISDLSSRLKCIISVINSKGNRNIPLNNVDFLR